MIKAGAYTRNHDELTRRPYTLFLNEESDASTALMASAAELVIPPVYPEPSPMG